MGKVIGERFSAAIGQPWKLPILPDHLVWTEVSPNATDPIGSRMFEVAARYDEPRPVGTIENLEQIIKDREEQIKALTSENYKMHREFDEVRQAGLEQNRKLQEQADKFRELYHEQVRARDKAIQEKAAITKAFDERGEMIKEDQRKYRILQEEYNDLSSAMKETDKIISETKEAGVNPEWLEYENLQKEKTRLENESLSLDNKKKQAELNGYEDYPHSVYQRLHSKVEEVMSTLTNRVAVIWVALVAFGVNEVIQWLTR